MSSPEQFHLQWRGGRYGPWDLAAIREALNSGSIHSLYQIHAGGKWQPLRDFLESLPRAEAVPKVNPPLQPSTKNSKAADVASLEKNDAPSPLTAVTPGVREIHLRQPDGWGEPGKSSHPPAFPPLSAQPYLPQRGVQDDGPHGTNGLAIACLVLSLCFWIPLVNIVSGFLSLIFGHIALVQIGFQPTQGGRVLAMTGLGITYAVLIFALALIFLKPFFLLQP